MRASRSWVIALMIQVLRANCSGKRLVGGHDRSVIPADT